MSARSSAAQGAQHGVVLGAPLGAGGAAEAGSVDEADRAVGRLDDGVDGVAGGPRHVVDHRALLAEQLVEEGRLAHVGPPDDGHPWRATGPGAGRRRRRLLLLLGRQGRRQEVDHGVEEVAGAPPVQGADREGIAHPEGDELPGGRLPVGVVDLVHHQADRWAGPADDLGCGQVLVGHPGGHVDHQEHHVGLGQGPFGLLAHLGVERVASGQPAAGVHDGEGHADPLGRQHLAVAGDAGLLLDHGRPLAHDAVDQGRLADVGPPGHDDHGQLPGLAAGPVLGPPRVDAHAAQADRNERAVEGGPQRAAVGGHHFDGPGQVGQGQAVEEPALVQAGVGKQVPGSVGPAARARARSSPVSRPATPMLPAEEVVGDLADGDVAAGVVGQQGPQDAGAVGPGQHGHRPGVDPRPRDRGPGQARRPVALSRRGVDRGEEAVAHPAGPDFVGLGEGVDEGPGHADAVLVLGEPVVGPGGGERAVGQQVVLVGGIDQPAARASSCRSLCHSATVSTTKAASSVVWARISASLENWLMPSGHDPDRGQLRVLVEHAGQRVLERHAVVDARADDDLAVHLDAPVEQHAAASAGWSPPWGCAACAPAARGRCCGSRRTGGRGVR